MAIPRRVVVRLKQVSPSAQSATQRRAHAIYGFTVATGDIGRCVTQKQDENAGLTLRHRWVGRGTALGKCAERSAKASL